MVTYKFNDGYPTEETAGVGRAVFVVIGTIGPGAPVAICFAMGGASSARRS